MYIYIYYIYIYIYIYIYSYLYYSQQFINIARPLPYFSLERVLYVNNIQLLYIYILMCPAMVYCSIAIEPA